MNCVTMAFEKKRRNFAKKNKKTLQKKQKKLCKQTKVCTKNLAKKQNFAQITANKTLQKNKTL